MSKIESQNAPEPVGSYPHARKVDNLLFLSGVGPREKGKKEIPGVTLDEKGKIISYDIEAQCHSVFANVKAMHRTEMDFPVHLFQIHSKLHL